MDLIEEYFLIICFFLIHHPHFLFSYKNKTPES